MHYKYVNKVAFGSSCYQLVALVVVVTQFSLLAVEFVRLVQAFYTNTFRLHELVIVYLLVVTVLIIVIILRSHFNEASCQGSQDYCGAPDQLDS